MAAVCATDMCYVPLEQGTGREKEGGTGFAVQLINHLRIACIQTEHGMHLQNKLNKFDPVCGTSIGQEIVLCLHYTKYMMYELAKPFSAAAAGPP